MNKKNMIGLGLSCAFFVGSFWFMGGLGAYWNLAALLVVVSGLAASVLLSYPFEQLREALFTARRAYTGKQANAAGIVRTLLDLAVQSRVDGVLSLERNSREDLSDFLKTGLGMLVDNCKAKEIRSVMGNEMAFHGLRRRQSERIFLTMAKTAPAFGVAGSVIGLIGLLMGINDTDLILQSIPVALISTLYGVVLANMVLAPVAESIHTRTRDELLHRKLIIEGLVAMRTELNPYQLERRLCSFLSPAEREGQMEALRAITRKHIERRRRERREAEQAHLETGMEHGTQETRPNEKSAEHQPVAEAFARQEAEPARNVA